MSTMEKQKKESVAPIEDRMSDVELNYIINAGLPSPMIFYAGEKVARLAVKAGMFNRLIAEKINDGLSRQEAEEIAMAEAQIKIMKGIEIKIKPQNAMENIYVINGKAKVEVVLMAALIERDCPDKKITIIEQSDKKCVIEVQRSPKHPVHKEEFTIEMARLRGLMDKDQYKKNTAWMLYKRCFGNMSEKIFPDITRGIGVLDEGELDDLYSGKTYMNYPDNSTLSSNNSTDIKINASPSESKSIVDTILPPPSLESPDGPDKKPILTPSDSLELPPELKPSDLPNPTIPAPIENKPVVMSLGNPIPPVPKAEEKPIESEEKIEKTSRKRKTTVKKDAVEKANEQRKSDENNQIGPTITKMGVVTDVFNSVGKCIKCDNIVNNLNKAVCQCNECYNPVKIKKKEEVPLPPIEENVTKIVGLIDTNSLELPPTPDEKKSEIPTPIPEPIISKPIEKEPNLDIAEAMTKLASKNWLNSVKETSKANQDSQFLNFSGMLRQNFPDSYSKYQESFMSQLKTKPGDISLLEFYVRTGMSMSKKLGDESKFNNLVIVLANIN